MKSHGVAAFAGLALAASFWGTAVAQIQLGRPGGQGGGQAGPAQQQPGGTLTSINEQTLIRLLTPSGLQNGEVLKVEGTRAIKGTLNGTPVFAELWSCQNTDCAGYSLVVFFGEQNVGPDFINNFNSTKRFGRLYLDKRKSLNMQLDVFLSGGVSPASVSMSGALFGSLLQQLIEAPQ